MEPKLDCGKVAFKGKDFSVYRNPERLVVWISDEQKVPFSFKHLRDYMATTDEEARKQAMLMLKEFEHFFVD